MRIARHRLQLDDGTPVPFRRSPNQSAGILPEYLVVHYTAGASAVSSIAWLTNPAARASAHLVIDRAGAVTQLVRFDRAAWHAGRSRWEQRSGLNRYSFGIELANCGALQRGATGWFSAWGAPVDDAEVLEAPHKNGGPVRGWQIYPTAQLESAAEVANLLVRHYGLRDVIGHDDIAPGRKTDPGPAFPMDSFRARVLGRADEEAERAQRVQTSVALNIREGPGTRFDKLPASPLPAGTKLEILASQGVWREVAVHDTVNGDADVEGWVHGRYLRPIS